MSRSTAIWTTLIIGIVLIGTTVISIRRSVKNTPESVQQTARDISSGGHLNFGQREEEKVVADLGIIGRASQVRHRFEFTNVGLTPVKIERLEVVNGPIKIIDYPQIVAPSAEAGIAVEFNPYGLKGDQEGVILLDSNDVKFSRRELVIKATVSDSL